MYGDVTDIEIHEGVDKRAYLPVWFAIQGNLGSCFVEIWDEVGQPSWVGVEQVAVATDSLFSTRAL
jgi:hypothetical protein